MKNPTLIYLDFEYHSSNEKNLVPVSVAWVNLSRKNPTQTAPRAIWLHESQEGWKEFRDYLESVEEPIIVSFQAAAETRPLEAMGIDPLKFSWIDLMVEYTLLRNENPEFEYGKVIKNGEIIQTKPIHKGMNEDEIKEDGDHGYTDVSLPSLVLNMLGIVIDSEHKDRMRDLILSKGPYSDKDKEEILFYNKSDVIYMPECHNKLAKHLGLTARTDEKSILRGNFASQMGKCESVGIPINPNRFFSLSMHHKEIVHTLIEECNEVYPFYTKVPEKRPKGFVDVRELEDKQSNTYPYTFKAETFATFLEAKGLTETWPKTASGKPATDGDTLDKYSHIPEIKAFRGCNDRLGKIGWFRSKNLHQMLGKIGSDFRMRTWIRPFGTKTGRNAPAAKSFVFAMSSWLRALIDAPKGYAITGMDWASQEFAIAAALSKDEAMIDAYRSGDVYLWFAKQAGAVPEEARFKWKEIDPVTGKEVEMADPEVGAVRDLFKATVLGLQYGMGVAKLAVKLTTDTGIVHTVEQAKEYVDLHKRTFPQYWKWADETWLRYEESSSWSKDCKEPALEIGRDGWRLYRKKNTQKISRPSVCNWPVQSTGAAIMRAAVDRAMRKYNLQIPCPLHDALYCLHKIEDTELVCSQLKESMDYGVKELLGDIIEIRIDDKTIPHGQIWIEKKGKKNYEKLGQYLFDPEAWFETFMWSAK